MEGGGVEEGGEGGGAEEEEVIEILEWPLVGLMQCRDAHVEHG